MKFAEFTITTTHEAEELVADIMWNYSSYGVNICSAADVIELIENRRSTFDYIEDEVLSKAKEQSTLVKAYVALDIADEISEKIRSDLESLKERSKGFIEVGTLETVRRTVDGDDWIEIWKKHYRPIELGNVVVCPAWIDYEPKKEQVKVLIDSNMAFGTGEHETTSMVIEIMQKYVASADTVIDVGTGSGILGISAAKLGAKKVFMTDIDYVAVKTATHNVELNGVKDKCEVCLNNLLDEKQVKGQLILANITADVLLILSENIVNNVVIGGLIVMSGIIKGRYDEVLKRYSSLGFEFVEKKEKGEWIALAMKRV